MFTAVLLIAGNGSGKSTLLKAIYTLMTKWDNSRQKNPYQSVYFMGEDITYVKPYQLIQKGLVYVPKKNNNFEQLSVIENLEVAATHLHNPV
jgi:ABC-type branched-subunit amino acid transport system ATPase component